MDSETTTAAKRRQRTVRPEYFCGKFFHSCNRHNIHVSSGGGSRGDAECGMMRNALKKCKLSADMQTYAQAWTVWRHLRKTGRAAARMCRIYSIFSADAVPAA